MMGGLIPENPEPNMTPEARAVWLATHQAPPGMLLTTEAEMDRVLTALKKTEGARRQMVSRFGVLTLVLGDYYRNEPDMTNAVASAVFDAERYKKAVDLVLPKLKAANAKIEAADSEIREARGPLYRAA